MWVGLSCFSLMDTGMSGNFLSCSKGVKDPLKFQRLSGISLDTPERKWSSSPGGENLLDFLELRQVLSTYDGNLRDPLWWTRERPVPM